MSVFDMFKPKWKSSDSQVRCRAVQELDDQDILLEICQEDSDVLVRGGAIKKLRDASSLELVISSEEDSELQKIAGHRLNKIYSQKILSSDDQVVNRELISKIDDEVILTSIAVASEDNDVCELILSRIQSSELLVKIVRSAVNKKASKGALEQIDDKATLIKLAASAPTKQLKKIAQKRVDSLETTSCDIVGKTVVEKLETICTMAEKTSDSLDWQKARSTFEQLAESWGQLDPVNEHGDLKQTFRFHCEHFNEREELHLIAREAIAAKENISEEVKQLLNRMDESVTADLENQKIAWNAIENIPFEKAELLDKEFVKLCESVTSYIADFDKKRDIRLAQIAVLEALCMEAEKCTGDNEVELNMSVFARLEAKWLVASKDVEDISEMTTRYQVAVAGYQAKKAELDKTAAEAEAKDLAHVQALCDELTALVAVEKIKDSTARIKELELELKGLKRATSPAIKELVSGFKTTVDNFFSQLKTQYESEDLDRWAHYTKLQNLAEQAERLLIGEINHHDVIKKVKELRKQWKETGSAPREKADEVWNRFNGACESAFAQCREFFDVLDSERDGNLLKKVALCEKVEALKESSDWKQTAEAIKQIQADWKDIGHVPKDKEKETYERFRASCDFFFDRRKEDFQERDKLHAVHAEEKQLICQKATKIVDMDWTEGSQFAKELRDQWKKVGSARRSDEDKLWQEFNGCINSFYDKFESERPGNLIKKTALCQQIEELLSDLSDDVNFRDLNNKVTAIKKSWDETGPVPKENDNEIWDRFNAPMKTFNHKRRAFFVKSDAERGENLKKKELLIEELEKVIAAQENWKEAADAIKQIQAQWKAVGPAPKECDQEIWTTFRGLCDDFFAKRQEFFSDMDSKRESNLKRKVQISVEIEKIVGMESDVEDDGEAVDIKSLADELKFSIETNFSIDETTKTRASSFERIKELQAEWKTIGPVPKSDDKALFSRYRAACDKFFEKKEVSSK